jgi:hypothetical protein
MKAGITIVALNFPGGSLEDALAMGRLIRDKGMATEVEAGATCASSCPLVFAGGDRAAPRHHGLAAGMESAQRVSARSQNTCRR